MKIEPAKISDCKNIASLAVQVWLDTYATEGIRDVFTEYVWNELSPQNITKKFVEDDHKFFTVKKNNHLIGFVEMNEESPSPMDENSRLEIDKLYIQNNFCGKNIGTDIINFLCDYYKSSEFNEMWLTVYENNLRAIKFYQKNNFLETGEFYFQLEDESHRNLVMTKKIK